MNIKIIRIVSGGQTGADRAALDFAICNDIPHGGWCPKGRKAEDGVIHSQYQLTETPTDNYDQRTEWNVRDSDATVIFTMSHEPQGGSSLTADFATKHDKPSLHISPGWPLEVEVELIRFIDKHQVRVLNVAGSRSSTEPGVYSFTLNVLKNSFPGNSLVM